MVMSNPKLFLVITSEYRPSYMKFKTFFLLQPENMMNALVFAVLPATDSKLFLPDQAAQSKVATSKIAFDWPEISFFPSFECYVLHTLHLPSEYTRKSGFWK